MITRHGIIRRWCREAHAEGIPADRQLHLLELAGVTEEESAGVIILRMPRRTPALYLWALRMRLRNRRCRS